MRSLSSLVVSLSRSRVCYGPCYPSSSLGLGGRREGRRDSSSFSSSSSRASVAVKGNWREEIRHGPDLEHFMNSGPLVSSPVSNSEQIPYLDNKKKGLGLNFFIETYGCQMNVADTEVLNSIMIEDGFKMTDSIDNADVIFLNTCAIRDNAEAKVWRRLHELKSLKKKKKKDTKIGVLGCMAERLKTKLLEEDQLCDLVAGPDAYRHLPHLVSQVQDGHQAINVILSADETYADVMPVRVDESSKSAFVSIMRGCNNMCSYCIVPFTRGRERSRPIGSILDEINVLNEQGYKEVTVLGQNVNSYHDLSTPSTYQPVRQEGFKTMSKQPQGGTSFVELIDRISAEFPEMRVRFTSPHPKDFPEDLFQLIKERNNVCSGLHMPAQSGSSKVLDDMRRGYTRETYVALIKRAREVIPHVKISSDFISGFCGETEEDHELTLSLLKEIEFDSAFMFAYSMREKTHAHRRLQDDVDHETKQRRLREVIDLFHSLAQKKLEKDVGGIELVLVEGKSIRNPNSFTGRTCGNLRVFFADDPIPYFATSPTTTTTERGETRMVKPGDYVAVQVTSSTGKTLRGKPLYSTTLQGFNYQRQQ